MRPDLILDPSQLDLTRPLADVQTIRAINPHRHELELVSAVVFLDLERRVVAGYLDISPDAFWVRGHFPGHPIMPGVLMLEAAAQVCSYYVVTQRVMEGKILGLGGFEEVRYRATVRPGDRLVIVGRGEKLNRRQTLFHVQGFVGDTMVFHGNILGVPVVREDSVRPASENIQQPSRNRSDTIGC